jgi:hypothetical protein
MARTQKAMMKASARHPWRGGAATDSRPDTTAANHAPARGRPALAAVSARLVTPAEKPAQPGDIVEAPAIAAAGRLSVRAENVLKELAAELAGESPPRGRWTPSDSLLRKLKFEHLLTARNCGPQTIDEIVRWAAARGVTVRSPSYAGKSLAAMWRDMIAKFPSGEFTRTEIAEALERSMRRKNTKIPVAFQAILLQLLMSGN